jgi:hypothetical protein
MSHITLPSLKRIVSVGKSEKFASTAKAQRVHFLLVILLSRKYINLLASRCSFLEIWDDVLMY